MGGGISMLIPLDAVLKAMGAYRKPQTISYTLYKVINHTATGKNSFLA